MKRLNISTLGMFPSKVYCVIYNLILKNDSYYNLRTCVHCFNNREGGLKRLTLLLGNVTYLARGTPARAEQSPAQCPTRPLSTAVILQPGRSRFFLRYICQVTPPRMMATTALKKRRRSFCWAN